VLSTSVEVFRFGMSDRYSEAIWPLWGELPRMQDSLIVIVSKERLIGLQKFETLLIIKTLGSFPMTHKTRRCVSSKIRVIVAGASMLSTKSLGEFGSNKDFYTFRCLGGRSFPRHALGKASRCCTAWCSFPSSLTSGITG